jgi:putative drug exporter of the RND superfamily
VVAAVLGILRRLEEGSGVTNEPRADHAATRQSDSPGTERPPGAPAAPGKNSPEAPVVSTPLGRALHQLRWPVLFLWVIAVAALAPLSSSLHKVTSDTSAAYLPASAQSTRVVDLQEAENGGGNLQSASLVVVFTRHGGLTAGDLEAASAARVSVQGLVGRIEGLGPPGKLQRSKDGEAVLFQASVKAPARNGAPIDTQALNAVSGKAQEAADRAGNGLGLVVTGQAAINAESGSSSQGTLLLTAVLIVAVVLLFVYRGPFLWLLPLLGAFAAIITAQAATHGLANAGLTVSSLSSSILIVLVFGAATDYAVLLIHRYREELSLYVASEDAMAAALRRTLPTLLASATTVTGAMLCLLAAESASLHGLGPVGAVAIVASLLAQATFLPALLLVCGKRAFWPRLPAPAAAGQDGSRVWSAVGARVARHPGRIILLGVVALGAACIGLFALHSDNDPLDNLKGQPESVVGAQVVTEHFGPGIVAPLVVLVPPHEATAAVATITGMPNLDQVSPSAPLPGYTSYSVTLSVDPYSTSGYDTIVNLRDQLAHDAPGSLVGGQSAIQYDTIQAAHRDNAVLIPLVLLVILSVIAMLLQAIVAPLVLVATAALSFGASFGLSTLIWRYGLGYHGIEAELPMYIFIFLVALGVDYNIFLSARIREEAAKLGARRGTLRGLAVTGGVITAAGIVLAGTFAALAQQKTVDVTEVGIAVALGVLLDTLLVRTMLVPAALLALDDRAWWPSRRRRGPKRCDGS